MVRLGVASGWAGSCNATIVRWHGSDAGSGDIYRFNRLKGGVEHAYTIHEAEKGTAMDPDDLT